MALVKGTTGSRIDDEAQQAAAAFGLAIEADPADPQHRPGLEVWPENATTVEVFISMGTQWNVGMSGAIGLRYEALPPVLALLGVPRAERRSVFAGLRVMEHAALGAMRDGR